MRELIGERIKKARIKNGLKQSELADMIGVKSSAIISNWEKNINKPDADKMIAICEVLNISLAYLLDYYGGSESPSPAAMRIARAYDKASIHDRELVEYVLGLREKGEAGSSLSEIA